MPKPKVETWQTCPFPQTPLQRGAFLDLCTEWMVQDGSAAAPVRLSPRTSVSLPSPSAPFPCIGFGAAELRLRRERKCGFCGEGDDAFPVLANPFTQQCMAMVCAACEGSAVSVSRRP